MVALVLRALEREIAHLRRRIDVDDVHAEDVPAQLAEIRPDRLAKAAQGPKARQSEARAPEMAGKLANDRGEAQKISWLLSQQPRGLLLDGRLIVQQHHRPRRINKSNGCSPIGEAPALGRAGINAWDAPNHRGLRAEVPAMPNLLAQSGGEPHQL